MHHPMTVFFDFNEGARILLVIFCKQGWDCVGWGISESKANDVVQGLAQNAAGCLAGGLLGLLTVCASDGSWVGLHVGH